MPINSITEFICARCGGNHRRTESAERLTVPLKACQETLPPGWNLYYHPLDAFANRFVLCPSCSEKWEEISKNYFPEIIEQAGGQ